VPSALLLCSKGLVDKPLLGVESWARGGGGLGCFGGGGAGGGGGGVCWGGLGGGGGKKKKTKGFFHHKPLISTNRNHLDVLTG